MKLTYANPTVEIVILANEDILTLSKTVAQGTPDSFNWSDLDEI